MSRMQYAVIGERLVKRYLPPKTAGTDRLTEKLQIAARFMRTI